VAVTMNTVLWVETPHSSERGRRFEEPDRLHLKGRKRNQHSLSYQMTMTLRYVSQINATTIIRDVNVQIYNNFLNIKSNQFLDIQH
jgi:hypothetical protein